MEHHLTIAYFTLNGKKRKHLNITIPLTNGHWILKGSFNGTLTYSEFCSLSRKILKKKKIIRLHFHLCFYYQYDSLAFIYPNSQTFTPKYNRGSRNDLWAISILYICKHKWVFFLSKVPRQPHGNNSIRSKCPWGFQFHLSNTTKKCKQFYSLMEKFN